MNWQLQSETTSLAVAEDYQAFFRIFTEVSKAIHQGEETGQILEHIVTSIKEILQAKGCIYWLLDDQEEQIVDKFSHGFSYRSLEEIGYDQLLTIFDRRQGDSVFIEDARHDPRIPDLERLGKRRVGSVTAMFFPIIANFNGLLAVYFHDTRPVAGSQLELVKALGEQGAIALHRSINNSRKHLQNMRQVVEGLALALEAKDERTHGHSVRVADFARQVAAELGLTESEIETVYHGGLLHDIGKIGMEDEILQRLGILSHREMDRVRRHPEIGARITSPLSFLHNVAPLILHHHERFDGSGYPDGLRGEDIPLGARILSVCDAFETMVEGRNYLAKMSLEDAVVNLQSGVGSQFDPKVVLALYRMLLKNSLLVPSEAARRALDKNCRELSRPRVFSMQSMF